MSKRPRSNIEISEILAHRRAQGAYENTRRAHKDTARLKDILRKIIEAETLAEAKAMAETALL